jgi:serine/threonine protein kinase
MSCCINFSKKKPHVKKVPGPVTQLRLSNNIVIQEGKMIGNSANKFVYEGILSPLGDRVVVKKIRFSKKMDIELDTLNQFIEITNSWDNENLVKYIGIDYNPYTYEFIIVTEFIPHDFTEIKRLTYKESQIRDYVRTLLNLLKFLYEKKLFFVNLRPTNVLADNRGTILIRDYIAADYLLHLKRLNECNSEEEYFSDLETVRNKDFIGLIETIKELYKVSESAKGEIQLSKECSDFIKTLNEFANKQISLKDFDVLLSLPYLVNIDTPSNYKNHNQTVSLQDPSMYNPKKQVVQSEYPAQAKAGDSEKPTPDLAILMHQTNTENPRMPKNWKEDLNKIVRNLVNSSEMDQHQFKKQDVPKKRHNLDSSRKLPPVQTANVIDSEKKAIEDELLKLFGNN